MYGMYVLHVFIASTYGMDVLHVCIARMYGMYVWYVWYVCIRPTRPDPTEIIAHLFANVEDFVSL